MVSLSGLLVGVAGATASRSTLLTVGVAGLLSGSVSGRRDSERAMLRQERAELARFPGAGLAELTALYVDKGLTPRLAGQVARELTEHDAPAAHADAELRIDPESLTNPVHAAVASLLAFAAGCVLPLLAVLAPTTVRVPVTGLVAIACLMVMGAVGAALGRAPMGRAVVRNVVGGVAAMAVTYGVGLGFGTAGL